LLAMTFSMGFMAASSFRAANDRLQQIDCVCQLY
jgi:hypothetical protein